MKGSILVGAPDVAASGVEPTPHAADSAAPARMPAAPAEPATLSLAVPAGISNDTDAGGGLHLGDLSARTASRQDNSAAGFTLQQHQEQTLSSSSPVGREKVRLQCCMHCRQGLSTGMLAALSKQA